MQINSDSLQTSRKQTAERFSSQGELKKLESILTQNTSPTDFSQEGGQMRLASKPHCFLLETVSHSAK